VTEISSEEIPKSFIDFGIESGLLTEDMATFPELKTWALYQFYDLENDSSAFGLEDQTCRMIPETGFKFLLGKEKLEGKGRMYLYLDLTKFTPQPRARFKSRKLSIFINGKPKKEIFIHKKSNFKNPVEIPIESSEFEESRIVVELLPSKNDRGRFWGIWDAFLVEDRLKER